MISSFSPASVECKFCSSVSVSRFGYTRNGVQRFICNHCRRTFIDNKACEDMRYPTNVVFRALNLFYEGVSVNKIRRQLQLLCGAKPDDMTIYRWIGKYCQKAAEALGNIPIKAGSMWVAEEAMITLREEGVPRVWFWYVLDHYTRFLLAFHFSESRRAGDAQILMERAVERAGKIPKTVIADKLAPYLDGVELAFGNDAKLILAKKPTTDPGIYLISGLRRGRTKAIRTFFKRETAKIFIQGWEVHYNYFRPNTSLGGRTPADAAGANAPFKNWADVVNS